MRKIICDFVFFVKNGYLNEEINSKELRFKHIAILHIVFTYLGTILFFFIAYSIKLHLNFELYPAAEHNRANLTMVAYMIIFAPIAEEMCCRYPLVKNKLGISFFVSIIFFTYGSAFKIMPYIILIWISLVLFFLLYFFSHISLLSNFKDRVYEKPRMTLYFLNFIFSVTHIFKYILSLKLLIVIPFILAPYFLSGLSLSYVRLRFSIVFSIFLHAFHNSIVIIPKFIYEVYN
jgi:hypothetical protein